MKRKALPKTATRAALISAKRDLLLEAALSFAIVARNPKQTDSPKVLLFQLGQAASEYAKARNE